MILNRNKMETIKMRKSAKTQERSKNIDIFMFVNPISGSREGVVYVELPTNHYDFAMNDSTIVHLEIINLLEKDTVDNAKEEISQSLNDKLRINPHDHSSVIILLAAGDGTFMTMAQELKNHGININMLSFVVFPFGTANDIARSFGWGETPSNKMMENLFLACQEILNAEEDYFDVWEIEVETDETCGDIQRPDGRDLQSTGETEMKRYMSHSFSFGSDARTGLAFERRRTRNRV
jgi:diacylglycerol kinase family enzyme